LGRCHVRPLTRLALSELTRAPTQRTASILLDQSAGALENALAAIDGALAAGDTAAPARGLAVLVRYADAGRHLTRPWRVTVTGAPNVGKSSLVNALAGYRRSVVT